MVELKSPLKEHLELMSACMFEDTTSIVSVAEQLMEQEMDGVLVIKLLFIVQATPEELEHYAQLVKSNEFHKWIEEYWKYSTWSSGKNHASLFDSYNPGNPYLDYLKIVECPDDFIACVLQDEPCYMRDRIIDKLIDLTVRYHAHRL